MLLRHALRNAAVPVITVIGTGFALLISGVVVTESVFNLPGIGRLTVDAVLARDYPVIQAMILLTSRHLCRRQSADRRRLHPARSQNSLLRSVLMAIETLPEPSIPITTPFRPGLGFLTATPIIAAATICLALVIAIGDPGALAVAARSPAAGAGAAAEAGERAIPARHRRLWPRRAVAHSLWRTDLAADRPRRRRVHRSASGL